VTLKLFVSLINRDAPFLPYRTANHAAARGPTPKQEHQLALYFHRGAGSLRSALSFIHDAGLALTATVNAIVNRYEAGRTLARLDSRMLADIGLTENDVGSAFSEPLWRDPTRRLAVIAIERRTAVRAARRRPAATERKNAPEVVLH
jgi:uncharacterized protein YjiS (DUF1127 family)